MDVNGSYAFVGAFSAGLVSFFAPCVLPLVPSLLIYISGVTIQSARDLSDARYRRPILLHTSAFILGFSLVFVSLGLSSSFLGGLFNSYQRGIMAAGGVLLILMGLNMLGLLKIPFLNREKVVHVSRKPAGLLGSLLVGITFSLGWTPCIGPVLASILLIAATGCPAFGGLLLGAYSLGLAIPFFMAGLLAGLLMNLMQRFGHVVRYTYLVLGGLLIALGLSFVTGYFTALARLVG